MGCLPPQIPVLLEGQLSEPVPNSTKQLRRLNGWIIAPQRELFRSSQSASAGFAYLLHTSILSSEMSFMATWVVVFARVVSLAQCPIWHIHLNECSLHCWTRSSWNSKEHTLPCPLQQLVRMRKVHECSSECSVECRRIVDDTEIFGNRTLLSFQRHCYQFIKMMLYETNGWSWRIRSCPSWVDNCIMSGGVLVDCKTRRLLSFWLWRPVFRSLFSADHGTTSSSSVFLSFPCSPRPITCSQLRRKKCTCFRSTGRLVKWFRMIASWAKEGGAGWSTVRGKGTWRRAN